MAGDDVFIICTDIFPTLTTELANLILPTAFHFEKTGVYGCTERRSQIDPQGGQGARRGQPEVWIVREWAKRLAKKLNDPVIASASSPSPAWSPRILPCRRRSGTSIRRN
jgi:nitrate reductase (cytochrome)